MAPKFRGDSEDWMDSAEAGARQRRRVKPKKIQLGRSLQLKPEDANAVVTEVFPNQCRVKLDQDGSSLLCPYRRAGIVGKAEVRERSPVAVGDRVLVTQTDSKTGIVEGVSIRRNSLSRPAPGRDGVVHQHVLAANIDLLVIVASVKTPDFTTGIIDRFLVAAESEGIPALIALTKVDLLSLPLSESEGLWNVYLQLGYPVFEISSVRRTGFVELRKQVSGKKVVFCGQSGVGKTSLLRVLCGNETIGRVGSVNAQTGKGRHTTTSAVLLEGTERHSQWIDTPGVREFGLTKIDAEGLAQYFPEFRSLPCTGQGCDHTGQTDCDATELARYSSYRKILSSLKDLF